jgi:hypothetical protein
MLFKGATSAESAMQTIIVCSKDLRLFVVSLSFLCFARYYLFQSKSRYFPFIIIEHKIECFILFYQIAPISKSVLLLKHVVLSLS